MKKLTALERISGIIYGRPKTLMELKLELNRLTGSWMLETAIAARLRELRKKGYIVICKAVHREGKSTLFTYEIPRVKQKSRPVKAT